MLLVILLKDVLYLAILCSSGATLAARVTYTLARVTLSRIYIPRIFPRCPEEVQSPRGVEDMRHVLDPFEKVLERETSFAYVRIDNTHFAVELKLY